MAYDPWGIKVSDPNKGREPFDTKGNDNSVPVPGHPDWAKATQVLADLLTAQTDEKGYVQIRTGKTGKYGRWLVDIEGVNDSLAKVWPYE